MLAVQFEVATCNSVFLANLSHKILFVHRPTPPPPSIYYNETVINTLN